MASSAESSRLLIIKVGTSSLMTEKSKDSPTPYLSLANIGRLIDIACKLKEQGFSVVLVTSGAVGAGCLHLKLQERPSSIQEKRGVAAVGQCRLMRLWEDLFAFREQKVAQLLMTRSDFSDKVRFLNFKSTLLQLLSYDVIPLVNENDSVATAKMRLGDNDQLAAYCAINLGARWLFILSDVDCLYTANPRLHPDAQPIPYVGRMDDVYSMLVEEENEGSKWGTGGMRTKIIAAKISSAAGVHTAIIHGEHPERMMDILDWDERYQKEIEDSEAAQPEDFDSTEREHVDTYLEAEELAEKLGIGRGMDVGIVTAPKHVDPSSLPYVGTVFFGNPSSQHLPDQRRWILSLPVRGKLFVDGGAAYAVIVRKKSLFAAGVVRVEGDFLEGESVSVYLASAKFDEENELARCLVNFNSRDLVRVKGLRSDRFKAVLNNECHPEVAIRSNIIFVNPFVVYDRSQTPDLDRDRIGSGTGESSDSETGDQDTQDDPHDSDPRLAALDPRRLTEKWFQAASAL